MKHRPLCLLCLPVILWMLLTGGKGEGSPSPPAEWEETQVVITGQVCGLEFKNETQRIYLNHISNHLSDTNLILPKVLIFTKEKQNISLGNWIRAEGICTFPSEATNPGQFDMKSYYRIQKVGMILLDAKISVTDKREHWLLQKLADVKGAFSHSLTQVLGERQGSVMSAMLLGEKGGLDPELKSLFQAGGIAHILAISGLHISMIGMGIYQVIRKLTGRFLVPGITSGGLLILYGILTGMPVSAKRAILMFLVYLGAQILGRTYDLLSAMSLSCIWILLEEPAYLYQAAFQLSFLAILGIGVLLPALSSLWPEKNRVTEALSAGLSIQIATLPCTLYWFSEFAVAGFLLNLAVIPMAGIAMAFGGTAGILYPFCPIFGTVIAAPCHYILSLYESLCLQAEKQFGNMGVWGHPDGWKIIAYYLIILLSLFAVNCCVRKERFGIGRGIWTAAAACSMFLLWIRIPRGLEMTFLDVGQGDAVFWQSDTGRTYLCDGGSSTEKNVGIYRIEPFLKWKGIAVLDYLMATHMDADHINGIRELLEPHIGGIQIGCLVLPEIRTEDETYNELIELAKKRGIPVKFLKSRDVLRDGELHIRCLWPEALEDVSKDRKNEFSLVLQLEYEKFRVLLTGDLEGEGEERLLESKLLEDVDLLKVAHHGSGGATSEEFLEKTSPAVTVLSYGKGNTYGHPNPQLLDRLQKWKCVVYETALGGAVTVQSDGNLYEVHTFNGD